MSAKTSRGSARSALRAFSLATPAAQSESLRPPGKPSSSTRRENDTRVDAVTKRTFAWSSASGSKIAVTPGKIEEIKSAKPVKRTASNTCASFKPESDSFEMRSTYVT